MSDLLQLPDGGNLSYELHSPEHLAERPAVVFLNGMTQTMLNWQSQVSAFRRRTAVLTYDARGQGQTALGQRTPSLEQHALDLVALLDHLDLGRVHLVGFSHGARVALATAVEAPERVERLVLCSATAAPTAMAQTIVRSWRQILERGGLEAMAWAALPSILGERFLQEHQKILDRIVAASVQRNTPEGIGALVAELERAPELAELARQVQCPTLVLSASDDPMVTAAGASRLAELAGGHHRLIADCGHTIPIEAPLAFRASVTEFLDIASTT